MVERPADNWRIVVQFYDGVPNKRAGLAPLKNNLTDKAALVFNGSITSFQVDGSGSSPLCCSKLYNNCNLYMLR